MIRNLTGLGFALATVLAMTALAAQTAQGETQGELTTEGGQAATLDVREREGAATLSNSFTLFGASIHCPGTVYTGHKYDATPHELIPNESTTITITPHYATKCLATGERQLTIATNGCDFVLHIGEAISAGTWPVNGDLVCPNPENGIHLSVWEKGAAEHASSNRLCTMEITSQTGLSGPHIVNTAALSGERDSLDIQGVFSKVHVERTGLCVFDGKGTTTSVGQLHIDLVVKGTDSEGSSLGITVTDETC